MNVEHGTRVRLAVGAILALVFAAGIALGFALDRDPPTNAAEVPTARSEGFPGGKKPSNGWVIDRLDLTDEQRSRVDSVIQHFGSLMSDLQKSYRPQYRAVVDSTDRALRNLLTEEQLVRYDSMKAAAEVHSPHERDFAPHR